MLTNLLEQVSRSFYLTLRVLPSDIRPQIGLAYLLARTTDTVADTTLVSLEQRLDLLEQLRGRIVGTRTDALSVMDLSRNQESQPERKLLEHVETSLAILAQSSAEDRALIRKVLDTITSGQVLDLKRFAGANADLIVALRTREELDDYTYRVAGCVGEFWTKICLQDHFRGSQFLTNQGISQTDYEMLGVRFGKGLQLVNILRDLPADLRSGRCYIPSDMLQLVQLAPSDLLDPQSAPRLRPVFHQLVDDAQAHLEAGWRYTNLIPRSELRLRLACAWPILIGMKTLKRLRAANVLDASQRIKISRAEVRQILVRSLVTYPLARWRNLARSI
ncbi:MAG TPA: phytoene/squalene synthase family protein [Verrucomicrobiae bacterium]|nr:phytoene/squalene synthase family protein [Verrucomicrobiae bacterium]